MRSVVAAWATRQRCSCGTPPEPALAASSPSWSAATDSATPVCGGCSCISSDCGVEDARLLCDDDTFAVKLSGEKAGRRLQPRLLRLRRDRNTIFVA